jgi:hypothetical protein
MRKKKLLKIGLERGSRVIGKKGTEQRGKKRT